MEKLLKMSINMLRITFITLLCANCISIWWPSC